MESWKAAAFAAALCLAACGKADDTSDQGHHGEHVHDHLSGATCTQGSTLSYANFGKTFMDTYCTSCHSSALKGAARQGAPDDHNLDTLALIRATGTEHIDQVAAAGPDRVNVTMPPSGPAPSEEERRLLGEWLACGAP
jgi:cytochrome c5